MVNSHLDLMASISTYHMLQLFMHCISLSSQMVLQNVDKAQVKLRMKKDNVAGMYTGESIGI